MRRTLAAVVAVLGVGLAIVPMSAQEKSAGRKPITLTPMDRIEINALVARYGYALDSGADDGYAYADLFAPDGVFIGMNQGASGRAYKGRDSLAALARGGKRGPNYVSHFLANPLIEATPDGAKGRQYAMIAEIGEGRQGTTTSTITNGGHYEDVYVKTPAGWRFKSRAFYGSESGPTPRQATFRPEDAPFAPAASPSPAAQSARQAAPKGTLTIQDYQEIQQLVNSYPYALDTGANNGYMYADLFAPDGEFVRPPTKGRDNLAKMALEQPHGQMYVRHFLANQLIEPTADGGATGKQYLVVIDIGEAGKPGSIFVGGHYEDIYAKTPQGWKFKRREFIPSRAGVRPPEAQTPR